MRFENTTIEFIDENSTGSTLVELLFVLILLSILLILAVPSAQQFLEKNRTISQLNILISGLYYARSESIIRNEKLTFCKSADQKTCGGQWRDGQILIDIAGNVLRVFPPLAKKNNLIWNSSGGTDDAITWLPTGYTQGQRGTFFYCIDNDIGNSRRLVVSDTGRLYVLSISAADYVQGCMPSS